MIVDEAEEDLELVQDPFLEAGISIPPELPYLNEVRKAYKASNNFISRMTSVKETKRTTGSTDSRQSIKSLTAGDANIQENTNKELAAILE